MATEFVMFDKYDVPVGVTVPQTQFAFGAAPAESTLAKYGATYAKPRSECTKQEYEDAVRRQRDPRADEYRAGEKRRRAGAHGYSGGDGFTTIL